MPAAHPTPAPLGAPVWGRNVKMRWKPCRPAIVAHSSGDGAGALQEARACRRGGVEAPKGANGAAAAT